MKKLLGLALIAFAFASGGADALELDQQGCLEYAIWSQDIVWARDVGADRELTRASLKEMRAESDMPVFVLLLRDLDLLWDTKASPKDVMQAVARECIRRRGQYNELKYPNSIF